LHGIKALNDVYIRPLLFASKEDIIDYATRCKIAYREDQSNTEDKYIRNKIRLKVFPILKQINPSVITTLCDISKRLIETEEIYRYALAILHKKLIKKKDDYFTINIPHLKLYFKSNSTLLYELLAPFSFNNSQINDIMASLSNISGGTFVSPTHVLLRDRDCLIIKPIDTHTEPHIIIDEKDTLIKAGRINLQFDTLKMGALQLKETPPHIAYIDKDKLKYPLLLRSWEKGDRFKPLGMLGFKKLSDFFIDNKINLFGKQKIKLLISAGKIVWVVGLRADDRFKIDSKSKHILRIQILP